jgi:arylsulfatase A-like enzyme
VRVIDIAPTIAHAAGATISPLWQGVQLFDQSFDDGLRVMSGEAIGLPEEVAQDVTGDGDVAGVTDNDPAAEVPSGLDFAPMERVVFAQEDFEGNQLAAIRVGGWKLIAANEGNPRGLAVREMYQVSQDEGEESNLVGVHSEQQSALDDAIQLQIEEAMTISVEAADTELSPEDIARMRALGYME